MMSHTKPLQNKGSSTTKSNVILHLHDAVLPCRGYPLSIGGELEAVDGEVVAFVGEDAAFPPDVP